MLPLELLLITYYDSLLEKDLNPILAGIQWKEMGKVQ